MILESARVAVQLLLVIVACLAVARAQAEDKTAATATFFEKNIRPVLAGRCFKCHGAQTAKNDLRIDSRAALLKGGKHGPAIVEGDPEKSLLIRAVRYKD